MPPGRAVPVAALLRAAALFGIAETGLRVALARLRSQGLVDSDARGLYRLGAAAQAVNRQVRSWRRVGQEVRDWDGAWAAVHAERSGGRAVGGRRMRALRLLGFQPLSPRLHVRPDNLVGGVAALRERLDSLADDTGVLVFRLSELDRESDGRARGLWDVRLLERGYAESIAALETSAKHLPELSREAAMVESFRLGGDVIRQIVLDPLLPAPILDASGRSALMEAMRHYDALGRGCWKDWAGETVELAKAPAEGSSVGMAALA
jgi:phenylacetic acid degradation operon negative regulatory protein